MKPVILTFSLTSYTFRVLRTVTSVPSLKKVTNTTIQAGLCLTDICYCEFNEWTSLTYIWFVLICESIPSHFTPGPTKLKKIVAIHNIVRNTHIYRLEPLHSKMHSSHISERRVPLEQNQDHKSNLPGYQELFLWKQLHHSQDLVDVHSLLSGNMYLRVNNLQSTWHHIKGNVSTVILTQWPQLIL